MLDPPLFFSLPPHLTGISGLEKLLPRLPGLRKETLALKTKTNKKELHSETLSQKTIEK